MNGISSLQVSLESLRQVLLKVNYSQAHRAVCEEYALLFGRLEPPTDSGDASKFLALICGYRLRTDDSNSPFDTPMGADTEALFGWAQIQDSHIEPLSQIASETADPELKARFADLVWLRNRNHELGRLAAVAYIDSAERLISSKDILGEKVRLFRGLDLAAQIDRKGTLLPELVNRITSIVQTKELINCSLLTCLEALWRSRASDGMVLHELACSRARRISAEEPNPQWERRFWDIASRFASQAQDTDEWRKSMIEVAKTFEAEGVSASSNAVKAHNWEFALHQYRKIPGTESDRSRVHNQLLEAQGKIRSEMIPMAGGTIDISQSVEASVRRMRDKGIVRGLAELVLASNWPEEAYIRDQARDSITRYPLQNIFSNVKFGSTGKTAAKSPGAGFAGTDLSEDQLFTRMCEQYRYIIPVTVSGIIEPMRNELLYAHNVFLEDVAQFLSYSPFIPIRREALFVIGIHAGLHGRFVEALHVLIPQLENLIRCLHRQDGLQTSTLNKEGIQEEYDLNKLLRMPESESLLGKDLCLVLRVIFTERWGYNLRNELAHGMLSATAFFSEVAVYAWWLIFRVVCGPVAQLVVREEDQSATTTK